jgi:glycosyltransferase involved in cell wall biosynthesis
MVHYSHFDVDSRVQRQARALAMRGDQIDTVCLGGAPLQQVGDGSIRVHPVDMAKPRQSASAYVLGYARFFMAALKVVSRLERERHFDIVEVHNMPDFLTFTAALPKLRGAAVLLDVHDTFPELFATKFGTHMSSPAVALMKQEERISSRFADGMMVVTKEAGERLQSRAVGRDRMAVVMNTPDERVFGPPREPVELPAPGEPLTAIYHGGMAPRFGVETVVHAARILDGRLPDLRVRIYGASEEENRTIGQLAWEVAPASVSVAAQPTPFAEIPEKLAQAHVGIVPTLHDEFTELLLPVKLMEYIHMGLPVVSTRLPVIERYFGDGEVRFYEPGSARSLARALMDITADPEAARERARRAQVKLREIAWPEQCKTYLRMVDDLVAKSRRGARA